VREDLEFLDYFVDALRLEQRLIMLLKVLNQILAKIE